MNSKSMHWWSFYSLNLQEDQLIFCGGQPGVGFHGVCGGVMAWWCDGIMP
jgi:hypothetical protein